MHPAAYENTQVRSSLAFQVGENPKLELRPYERRALIRKIRTLENYSGLITRVTHGTAGYVVGTGISPIPSTSDLEFNERALKAWQQWSQNAEVCDRSGRMTVTDLLLSLAAGEMRDGEGFVAFQKSKRGIPQFLSIDPQFIKSAPSENAANVHDGVKTDKTGRVTGYYVNAGATSNDLHSKESSFHAKNVMLHLVDHRRAHRLRGKSCLHSAANNVHDLIDLLALEKQATKTHQTLAVHVKKKGKNAFSLEGSFDSVEEELAADGGTDSQYKKKPGTAAVFGPNVLEDEEIENVDLLSSDRPNANLTEFYELIVREVACSSCYPFEFLWNIGKVGGAPARYILADAYITIQQKQRLLTRQILFPLYRWWLASMMKLWRDTEGALGIEPPAPDVEWWSVDWQYPAKATMDIKHDGKQMIELLKHGLATETDIFEGAGKSRAEQVDRRIEEIAEVLEKCAERGIPYELYYQNLFQSVTNSKKHADESNDKKDDVS